jgi:hypothetical protein
MTKKELENKVRLLEEKIIEHDITIGTKLTITQARMRDYITRTNYLGKIKDKKIKEDFKNGIKEKCGDAFDSITTKILNYEFVFEGKNILYLFSELLKSYEYKQFILDTYGNKECK